MKNKGGAYMSCRSALLKFILLVDIVVWLYDCWTGGAI